MINALECEMRSENKELNIDQVKRDLNTAKTKYTIHNNMLNEFLKETKFNKDFTRLKI